MILQEAVAMLAETGTRQLQPGEMVPQSLELGFTALDPNWAWVTLVNGEIVGALLAAPCHSHVFLVRLVIKPQHGAILPALLRAFIRDVAARGYQSYVVYLDKERTEEARILRILKRAGKVEEWPTPQWFVGGRIADLEKW